MKIENRFDILLKKMYLCTAFLSITRVMGN